MHNCLIVDRQSRSSRTVSPRNSTPSSVNESKRKQEDNLAIMFIWIAIVFLVCHLPSNLLNMYEMITIERMRKCDKAGKGTFPIWCLLMAR